jgi:hypothetical protein
MVSANLRELAHRVADGVEISLLWDEIDGSLRVIVVDPRAGTAFEVPAPSDNALDVFYHPYAYAREAA